MTRMKWLAATALSAGVLAAPGAQADVTPAQVWAMWQKLIPSGTEVTVGNKVASTRSLALSDVTLTQHRNGTTARIEMPSLEFDAMQDGTVSVVLPQDIAMHIDAAPPAPPPAGANPDAAPDSQPGSESGAAPTPPAGPHHGEFSVKLHQDGADIRVSGDPGDLHWTGHLPKVRVHLDRITADGKPLDGSFDATASDWTTNGRMSGQGPVDVTSASQIDHATVRFDFAGKPGERITGTQSLDRIDGKTTARVLPGQDMSNLAAALSSGYAGDFRISYGAGKSSVDLDRPEGALHVDGSDAGGSLVMKVDRGQLAYDVHSQQSAWTVEGDELPGGRIEAGLQELKLHFAMPPLKSDTPQPFSLLTRFAGVTVGEGLWSLIDPKGALPHDPATLEVDLAGTGRWLWNILDPTTARAHPAGPPAEVDTLKLNRLDLAAAGAELTGTGSASFDNSQPGPPKPDGSVDLQLSGGNGLIDKLIAMGLLPKDQAMGARMMLAMFARPGDSPDTMVSKIQFNPDGSILANGQRIR